MEDITNKMKENRSRRIIKVAQQIKSNVDNGQARRNEKNSGGLQIMKYCWPTKKILHFKSSKTARKA